MRVYIKGNQSGRYYYDGESISCIIQLPPFSREAARYDGFLLQIITNTSWQVTIPTVSYNELVILRNILNAVIK